MSRVLQTQKRSAPPQPSPCIPPTIFKGPIIFCPSRLADVSHVVNGQKWSPPRLSWSTDLINDPFQFEWNKGDPVIDINQPAPPIAVPGEGADINDADAEGIPVDDIDEGEEGEEGVRDDDESGDEDDESWGDGNQPPPMPPIQIHEQGVDPVQNEDHSLQNEEHIKQGVNPVYNEEGSLVRKEEQAHSSESSITTIEEKRER